MVLTEDVLTDELLLDMVNELYDNRRNYIDAMTASSQNDAINTIISLIKDYT